MDRSQLRTLLAAGTSRRFSVLEATRRLEAPNDPTSCCSRRRS
jgi:hypothetical protein